MYDKLMLKKLDVPALPKARKAAVYRNTEIGMIARSAMAFNGNLLIVAFYERDAAANGFSIPMTVLYITKTEYTTRHIEAGRLNWRSGSIRSVLGYKRMWSKAPKVVCLHQSDDAMIRQFLPVDSDYWSKSDIDAYIDHYQSEITSQKLEKRYADDRLKYEALMKTVPPIPDSFEDWVDKVPFRKSRYVFFEKINDKIARGYCSRCYRDFLIDSVPRHKSEGVCPKCGEVITYRSAQRSQRYDDYAIGCLMQPLKTGGIVIRYFWLSRFYSSPYGNVLFDGYRKAHTNYDERARLFLDAQGQIVGEYKSSYLPMLNEHGFRKVKDKLIGPGRDYSRPYMGYNGGMSVNIWFRKAYLYPHNLRGFLKKYNLNYAIADHLKRVQPVDMTTYLYNSIHYPVASTFDKLGLHRLQDDILAHGKLLRQYHPRGSLHRRLCISKEQLALAVEHDFGAYHLNLLTMSQGDSPLRRGNPPMEDVKWIGDHRIEDKIVEQLLKYTTMHKIKKYVQQQKELGKVNPDSYTDEDGTIENIIAWYWADYLEMSSTLQFQTQKWRILFPKDVKDQHDKVVKLVQVKYDEVMDMKVRKIYPALEKKYGYQNSDFLIRPPRNFNDFVEEGAELMHCVASSGYYKYHAAQSSLIFFIRKLEEPDDAFFTMQYDHKEKRVLQLRGYKDCGPTEEVAAFRDEWLQVIGASARARKAA